MNKETGNFLRVGKGVKLESSQRSERKAVGFAATNGEETTQRVLHDNIESMYEGGDPVQTQHVALQHRIDRYLSLGDAEKCSNGIYTILQRTIILISVL
jgi:hypothetical protein